MRRAQWQLVALLLLVAGCGSLAPVATPHDADAVFRPRSMVADRDAAAPGDVVALAFPDEMTRGIHFVLEEEVGGTWVYRDGLISSGEDGGAPGDWFVPGDEDVAIPDIGIVGPGPDHVVIPEVATPRELADLHIPERSGLLDMGPCACISCADAEAHHDRPRRPSRR